MARSGGVKSSNHAYTYRARKRRGQRSVDVQDLADNIAPAALRAQPSKRYRYSNLQGEDRIEMLRMAQSCARAAMTQFEAAEYFGVTMHTFTEWLAKDPEFAVAFRINKTLADERVEGALYHRALGYSMRAEEVKLNPDGTVVRAEVIKHIPPDVGAMVFWLKNRQPHLWKDKIDVNANVDAKVEIEDKSKDPRLLAMAVLDVLQAVTYQKIENATIDGEVVDAKRMSEYTDAELENMDMEAIDRLMRGQDED